MTKTEDHSASDKSKLVNVVVPTHPALYKPAKRIIDSGFDIEVVREMKREALRYLFDKT